MSKQSREKNKAQLKQNVMQLLVGNEAEEPAVSDASAGVSEPLLVPLTQLQPFQHHPFQLYADERLDDMVESIRQHGVLVPLLVRPIEPSSAQASTTPEHDTTYEILSGHNRANAAKKAGLLEVPVIVKRDITDEIAMMYVVETNLIQRSFTDMLPTEQATILGLRHEKLFSQGKRNDIRHELELLSAGTLGTTSKAGRKSEKGSTSLSKAGAEYGLSKNTVARLLRINQLILPLKNLVDDGVISLRAGVLLSYLSTMEQETLSCVLLRTKRRITIKQATTLRNLSCGNLSGEKQWGEDRVLQILMGETAADERSSTSKKSIQIKSELYDQYFSTTTTQREREQIIEKALAAYYKNQIGR